MDRSTISWLVSALASPDGGGVEASEHEEDDDADDEHDGDEYEDDDHDHDREDDEDRVLLNEVIGATAIYPQEQGELQFNLKPAYYNRRHDHLGFTNFELEIGATDWLQFEVSWDAPMGRGGAGVDTVAGFGDFEIETQFTWMHMGDSLVSAALVFETSFPTARPEDSDGEELEFGEGGFAYEPYVTLAIDFPGGTGQVFGNFGAELSTEEQLPLVNVGVFVVSSIVAPYPRIRLDPRRNAHHTGDGLHRWEIVGIRHRRTDRSQSTDRFASAWRR